MGLVKPIGSLERGLSKEGLVAQAESDAEEVISSGQYDLLKVYVEMKRYEVYFSSVLDHIKAAALVVAKETGMKSFNYADAHVTNMQRSVYKFDKDPTWRRLHDEFESIKGRIKLHEETLKKIQGEMEKFLEKDTGELIDLIAPTKEVVETIMVKV